MLVIARIIGLSFLVAILVFVGGALLLASYTDGVGVAITLACAGVIVGAVAAAAREIVAAQRQSNQTPGD